MMDAKDVAMESNATTTEMGDIAGPVLNSQLTPQSARDTLEKAALRVNIRADARGGMLAFATRRTVCTVFVR